MRISTVIPVYNEEGNLAAIHQRLSAVLQQVSSGSDDHEILFVNDGSSDRSLPIIKGLAAADPHVSYLDLSRNFGHQVAVCAGLDHAAGDRVIIIDCDLQDPPELIPEMLLRMDEGHDVVYAKRRARAGESTMKRWTASLFYRLLSRITSVDIPVDTGDFRVVSRRVVEVLRQMPEREKFLRGQIAWMGFSQTSVAYDRAAREAGDTGYTYRKMIGFALDGITSFSDLPLKVATISGFLVSFISFVLMIYALWSRFVWKVYEPGWTSLMLSVLFIGGIQLIAVGIIGEYIGRISNNVKQRPLYLIREKEIRTGKD
ncbi:MAG: glycosyltransferase family 2 protein [Flavobacteriales bacterium]|nr:glycosyltransferase family 2 protein [Flavobacteriales bacterium]